MGRFGLSFRSKKHHASAWTEEMLVHKMTGEVLIKTPDDDVVSYNANSRRKQHITDIEHRAKLLGIGGSLYELDIQDGDYKLPDVIPLATNIIIDDPKIQGNFKKFLLCVDTDTFLYSPHELTTDYVDPKVTFTMTLRSNGIDVSYINKTINVSDLVNTVFEISEFTDRPIDEIQLSGLIFSYDELTANIRIVLNGILLVVE